MKTSETINELATALSLAQSEIEGAVKDSANPFFKSKYADLASVWDAIRAPFAKNGLSVVQGPEVVFYAEGRVSVLCTRLMHKGGQWIESQIPLEPIKNDPQGVGSAITYMRRYALQAMAGVAPEDDDGNHASGRQAMPYSKPAAPAAQSGYRINFGKYKDKMMAEVDPVGLRDYANYIAKGRGEKMNEPGYKPSPQVDSFLTAYQALIGASSGEESNSGTQKATPRGRENPSSADRARADADAAARAALDNIPF